MNELGRQALLADRLRAIAPVKPSEAARLRGWNVVASQLRPLEARPAINRGLALAIAMAALLLLVGGIFATAAQSEPDSALYPVKGVEENVYGAFLLSPSDRVSYHLDLAARRLDEAKTMFDRGRIALGAQALHAFSAETEEAARVIESLRPASPSLGANLAQQLRSTVSAQDRRLDALQARVQDPAGLKAISEARDRSRQAANTVSATPSPSVSPSASPTSSASLSPAASASASASASP
jgi:hypothetical protein